MDGLPFVIFIILILVIFGRDIYFLFISIGAFGWLSMARIVRLQVLGLRKKESIKVRQPLQKILIPSLNNEFENNINQIKDLILSEVNIKDIQLIKDDGEMLVKQIKPNFKSIGPKYGRHMISISKKVLEFTQKDISEIQKTGVWVGEVDSTEINLDLNDFEITGKPGVYFLQLETLSGQNLLLMYHWILIFHVFKIQRLTHFK